MDFTPVLLTILVILVGTGIYLFWPKRVTPPTSSDDGTTTTAIYSLSPFYPANYGYYGYYGYPWRIGSGWGGWRRGGGWHGGHRGGHRR